jgi:hypothetical protein
MAYLAKLEQFIANGFKEGTAAAMNNQKNKREK